MKEKKYVIIINEFMCDLVNAKDSVSALTKFLERHKSAEVSRIKMYEFNGEIY